MSDSCGCSCSGGTKFVFSCSGGADVGGVADMAARRLTSAGVGKMFCLAGIGGRVPGIMLSTQAADRILAIDGCALDCAKLCLEQAGFSNFEHLRLSDIGLHKGKTGITEDAIAKVVAEGSKKLA